MKRALCIAALLLLAAKPESWNEAYDRGVRAVNAANYAPANEALQRAIAEMPNETTTARVRNDIFVYVPHFWLGIAKFNLGEVDAALREWRTSEEQGAIQKTDYYAKLKDWVARAQTEKVRIAERNAGESKKAADAAISRALAGQVEALSAGADRSDGYRSAQRKLQEAMGQFHKAGTDIGAYQRAASTAGEARDLFAAAADEARKQKAARPAVVPQQQPAVQKPVVTQPAQMQQAQVIPPPQPQPQVQPPPVVVTQSVAPPPVQQTATAAPVESAALVSARIALQQYRRRLLDARSGAAKAYADHAMRESDRMLRELDAKPDDAKVRQVGVQIAKADTALTAELARAVAAMQTPKAETESRKQLEAAYRTYAGGDLNGAEAQLTVIINTMPSAEAYLLRGCARYARATLARSSEAMAMAESDFRSALALNNRLRLPQNAFSPKLIGYFEDLRKKQ